MALVSLLCLKQALNLPVGIMRWYELSNLAACQGSPQERFHQTCPEGI